METEVRYRNVDHCSACDHILTNHEKMYSSGRCPYCGVKGYSAGTVVDSVSKSVKYTIETKIPEDDRQPVCVGCLVWLGIIGAAIFMLVTLFTTTQ